MKLRKDDLQNLQPPGAGLQEHPLFSGSTSVGMISGENPRFPATSSGHEAMGEALRNLGLKTEERHGRYGTPEKSWMVYGPTREQMYALGKQFGQESVVYSSGGKHELLYSNGPNAGKFHPGIDHNWFQQEPEDYYTHMPEHGGYLRLNFDWNTLNDSPLVQSAAVDALQTRASGPNNPPQPSVGQAQEPVPMPAPPPEEKPVSKSDLKLALAQVLRKTIGQLRPAPHPHAYDWHNEHTDHHLHVIAPGVILISPGLSKADAHPHADGSKPPQGIDHLNGPNDQAAGVGVSTYAKFALPYGNLDKNNPTDLFHYPYHGKNLAIDQLVKDYGYSTYYAGGKYGRPDLATRNYNTKHLMIHDPSPGSGGDFGTEAYTDGWRKIHELAHALTYPELNKIYGEGRRIGKLGTHRTQREALRAVHWEWLAAHKQRELSQQIGVHVPDHVFHKELNTVMHDAVHRAVTGKFTEPSGEGYRPHEHKLPLETALGMVRESAHNLGVTGMHDLIKKSEGTTTMATEDEKGIDWNDARQLLAKSIRSRVEEYTKSLVDLRQRELKKALVAGPTPQMRPAVTDNQGRPYDMAGKLSVGGQIIDNPVHAEPAPAQLAPPVQDPCPLCGMEDQPGSCVCLGGVAKNEDCGPEMMKSLAPAADITQHPQYKPQSNDPEYLDGYNYHFKTALKETPRWAHGIAHEGGLLRQRWAAQDAKAAQPAAPVAKSIEIKDACKCASPTPSKLKGGPCQKCKKPAQHVPYEATKKGEKTPDKATRTLFEDPEPKVLHPSDKKKKKAKETPDSRLAPGPFYQGKPWQITGDTKKAELSAKAKEPVKAAAGNGVKIKSLNKGDFGMSSGGKVATTPAAGAPAPKAQLPKKSFGLGDLTAGKQKLQAAGVKPVSPLGMPSPAKPAVPAVPAAAAPPKAPGMGAKPAAAAPPPGVGHLAAPKPALGAPKPALAAPKAPAAAPKAPAVGKPMGKSENFNLGGCALCAKPEHDGECS